MSDEPKVDRPYAMGLATGLGVVLTAALVLALVDVMHAGGGLVALAALWSMIALPVGLFAGLVLGAGNAQWGVGWIRRGFARLRSEPALDRRAAAILLAGAVVAVVLIAVVAVLSLGLVADVQRKSTGALLLGVVVVGVLPVLALAGLPAYRVARKVTAVVPAVGPLSRVLVLVLLAGFGVIVVGAWVVRTKLDYQALGLGLFVMVGLLPVLAVIIALLAFGPLRGLRERLPRRGVLVAAALGLALLVVPLGLRTPSKATRSAVTERSYVGPRLIKILRTRIDRDGDGHSAFFGGPDCDDGNASVNPNAPEIPGNGLDDNCLNGDAPPIADVQPTPDAGTPLDATPPPSTLSGGKNVLIIFVDTLRFDRLGSAGYLRDGKPLTPRIDTFAKEASSFRRAYAQAPNTPRSVPSFLASRYPSQLQVDRPSSNYPTIADDADFLFEALGAAGMTTIGMSSHFYFCDRKRSPQSCPGVRDAMATNVWQGATEWDNEEAKTIADSNKDIAAPRIVAKATARLDQLAKSGDKFAMLVHLFEPHSTYVPHAGDPEVTARGDERLKHLYDLEVAAVDAYVGKLLDALETSGLAKTTTVVLLSDHGEAFGVHRFAGERQFFHGSTLYDEILHVPFMVRIPGAAPKQIDHVVELVDLAPTVAALFGVKAPASWRGQSLVPLLEGATVPPKAAYAEMQPVSEWNHAAKSMVSADGKWHVVYRISDSAWELYDLEKDPEERTNVFESNATQAAEMQKQLAGWMEGPLAQGGGR